MANFNHQLAVTVQIINSLSWNTLSQGCLWHC